MAFNSALTWPACDCDRLKQLADAGATIPAIAAQLGRPENEVHAQARRLRVPIRYAESGSGAGLQG